ncbi:putative zinc transporter 10 [Bienertia sinuspersici]
MHVLPDSWNNLTSPCLPENPWRIYPWSTFIAMVTTVLTMMMDTVATAYFKQKGLKRMHNHGHGGGATHHDVESEEKQSQLLRYRIVAQV